MKGRTGERGGVCGWCASYLQDIRATGHRDSYDSSPFSDPVGCFADLSLLLFHVPVALLLFVAPPPPSPIAFPLLPPPRVRREIVLLRSSSTASSTSSTRPLPSSFFSVTDDGLDTTARPDLLPLFPVRVLLFSSRPSSLLLPHSLSLSLPFAFALFLPVPFCLPVPPFSFPPRRILVHFAQ